MTLAFCENHSSFNLYQKTFCASVSVSSVLSVGCLITPKNVHSEGKPQCDLHGPVQGGSAGGPQGPSPVDALRAENDPEPAGHSDAEVAHLTQLRQGKVRLEHLLLDANQRGSIYKIYLRDCLHFPPEVVPATLIRRERVVRDSTNCKGVRQEGFVQRRDSEGREMYRRQPNRYVDKRGDVGSGTGELQFRGGFGRGNQYD